MTIHCDYTNDPNRRAIAKSRKPCTNGSNELHALKIGRKRVFGDVA
jgi:hypothetical protein